jgi:hypothetical protein
VEPFIIIDAMGFWLKRITLFLLPLMAYFVAFEWYCRHETFFAIKKQYALNNLSHFEVVFTGTSQIEKGIRVSTDHPKYLNWAAPGQSFPFEYELWKKYLHQMPNVKWVGIEMSPVRMYLSPLPDDWSANVYWIHYDIPFKVNTLNPRRSFHMLQDYDFFKQVVHRAWNPWEEKSIIETTGFAPNDFKERFWDCQYDTSLIRSTFRMKYDFKLSKSLLQENLSYLDSTLQLLTARGVRPFLIIPPLYKTFENAIPQKVNKEFMDALTSVKEKYDIQIFNFQSSNEFQTTDFYNDNHLNPDGAKKWFEMIQDSLAK